jgi:hypothetical protein
VYEAPSWACGLIWETLHLYIFIMNLCKFYSIYLEIRSAIFLCNWQSPYRITCSIIGKLHLWVSTVQNPLKAQDVIIHTIGSNYEKSYKVVSKYFKLSILVGLEWGTDNETLFHLEEPAWGKQYVIQIDGQKRKTGWYGCWGGLEERWHQTWCEHCVQMVTGFKSIN